MKTVVKSLVAMMFIFVFICCSKDEDKDSTIFNTDIAKKSNEIVSPDGFYVAESIDQLQKELFPNNPKTVIESIDFITLNSNKGAAAYIKFNENGVSRRIGFVIGNITAKYSENAVIKVSDVKNGLNSSYSTCDCGGSGCCYATEITHYDTLVVEYFCKCENNPNGNSGCTMTVTTSSNYIAPANPGGN